MEKTSRWDGTAGDVRRMTSTRGLHGSRRDGNVSSRPNACLRGARILWKRGTSDKIQGSVKNKATYNQLIVLLLPDAPVPSLYKTVKKQDKLGPPHHATIFYLYNLLKAICFLSSLFKLYQFLCPPLLYPPSGLQSISCSSYLFYILSATSYFYVLFSSSL